MAMPKGTYDLFRPKNADLLNRMRQTPSQLPDTSIYEAWQKAPEHFSENISQYARQLDIGTLALLLKTTDFGPLEMAIRQCTLLPETFETFRRELPDLVLMYNQLFPPKH